MDLNPSRPLLDLISRWQHDPAGVEGTESLTNAFVSTLSSSSDPAASSSAALQLFNGLHSLVLPLCDLDAAPELVPSLSTYLIDSLHPALPSEHHLRLSDTLIDVVWQLEQAIEAGVLPSHPSTSVQDATAPSPASGAAQHEMQVDQDTKVVQDPAKLAAQAEQQKLKGAQPARERIGAFVKSLCTANVMSIEAVGERLELSSLAVPTLGVISNLQLFSRHEIRARTALYYKQQKFNLLREEMEGYSKLAVELLNNSGPPQSNADGRSIESEHQRLKRANGAMDKIKSLIGNFDLDPDRTIDLILDAFSEQVIDHYQGFLDLISVSPWAPSSKKNDGASSGKGKEKQLEVDVGLEDDHGNRVMAQILGFKFKFYQTPDFGETPEKLYLMTALLIWHGLIKLADLWPHLSPDDATLAQVESQYRAEQEKVAASVGGGNALAMAAALVDDDVPAPRGSKSAASTSTADADAAAMPRELPNQRLGLLKAMLTIGDLAHALFVLAQYPTLAPANLEVVHLLNRLLVVSLTPAYDSTESIGLRADADRRAELAAPRLVFESTTKTLVRPQPKTRILTGRALPDPIANKDQVFFFPDWQERLPRCGDTEEVLSTLEKTYAPVLGPFIALDLPAYTRICRTIKRDLSTVAPSQNPRFARWTVVIRQVLLPGASLLKDNSPAVLVLWEVLQLLSIEQRYQLYGEWKDALYRRIPALGVRKAETEREVKMVLRRLSTDNVKRLGKNLAKAAYNNPIVTFTVVLNQVQSYDNLIVPVVEAARYLSDLSYDVLTYSVLDALSSSKSKTKEDGTSIALWLQSLATFTGQLYRRWSALEPSLSMIVQYLVNQLVTGNSKDLIILRELITKMTGIEPFADLSDAQVLSLAGGKVLRSEVFFQTEITHASKSKETALTINSRERLGKVLERTGLSMPLLVNIALQRQACIAMDTHLKSLGALFDQNHAILFQFTELLLALMDPDEHANRLPTIGELVQRFGIEPAVAFDIGRPKLRIAMKAFDEDDAVRNKELEKRKVELRAKLAKERSAKLNGDTPEDEVEKVVAEVEAKVEEDVKMEEIGADEVKVAIVAEITADVPMSDATVGEAVPTAQVVKAPSWHPGLVDVIQTTAEILPFEVHDVMGAPFFVTFWQLTLYDILYPKERYDSELDRLNKMQREMNDTQLLPDLKAKFVQNIIGLANRLIKEAEEHRSARAIVSRRLTREAKVWFSEVTQNSQRKALIDQIVQYCIHPRAKLSLPDAVFSYQFIKRLHSMNTSGFHSILFYDRVLNRHLVPIIYSCSENEARNYARFLHDVLQDVHSWYHNEDKYKSEAIGAGLSGFARRPPTMFATTIKPDECFSHVEFRTVAEKWTKRMVQSFGEGFESGEYMHIKNSILVLTKIAPYFPIEYKSGVQLEAAAERLLKVEQRDDLRILAMGYKAVIAKRRKRWSNQPPPPPPPPKVEPKPKAASSAPASASSSARPSPVPSGPANATSTSSLSSSSRPAPAAPGLPSRPSSKPSAGRDASRSTSTDHRPSRDTERPSPDASQRNDLPSRPTTNGSRSEAPSSSNAAPASKLPARPSATESELRAKALASSRNSTTSMRPPAATSTTPAPLSLSSSNTTSNAAAAAAPSKDTSRPASRPASPRGRDRSDRDEAASSRRRSSRDRSVESNRSSTSRRETRSSATTKEDLTSSRSSKDEALARSTGRDRREESDRDRERERERDRDRDRHHESSSSRSSRRSGGGSVAVAADEDRRRGDRKEEDKKRDDKRREDDKKRDEEKRRDNGRRESLRREDRDRDSRRRGEERGSQRSVRDGGRSRDPSPPRTLVDRLKPAPSGPSSKRDSDRGQNSKDPDSGQALPSTSTSSPSTKDLPPHAEPSSSSKADPPQGPSSSSASAAPPTAPASFNIRGSSTSASSRLLNNAGLGRSDPSSSSSRRGVTESTRLSGRGPADDGPDSRKRGADGVEELEVKRARTDPPPPSGPRGSDSNRFAPMPSRRR